MKEREGGEVNYDSGVLSIKEMTCLWLEGYYRHYGGKWEGGC